MFDQQNETKQQMINPGSNISTSHEMKRPSQISQYSISNAQQKQVHVLINK